MSMNTLNTTESPNPESLENLNMLNSPTGDIEDISSDNTSPSTEEHYIAVQREDSPTKIKLSTNKQDLPTSNIESELHTNAIQEDENTSTTATPINNADEDVRVKVRALTNMLAKKENELVRVLKREEAKLGKLRQHIQKSKQLNEKKNNTIEILFQLAVQNEMSPAELHARYREIVDAYEAKLPVSLVKGDDIDLDGLHGELIRGTVDSFTSDRLTVDERSRLKEEYADPEKISTLKNEYKLDTFLANEELSALYRGGGKQVGRMYRKGETIKMKEGIVTEGGRMYRITVPKRIEISYSDIQTDVHGLSYGNTNGLSGLAVTQDIQTDPYDPELNFLRQQTDYSSELKDIQKKYSELATTNRYKDEILTETGFILHNAKMIDMLNTSIDIIINPQDERKTMESVKMLENIYIKVALILGQVSPRFNKLHETLKWLRLQEKKLKECVRASKIEIKHFKEFVGEYFTKAIQELQIETEAWIQREKDKLSKRERDIEFREEVLSVKEEDYKKRCLQLETNEKLLQVKSTELDNYESKLNKIKSEQQEERLLINKQLNDIKEQFNSIAKEKKAIEESLQEIKVSRGRLKSEMYMIEEKRKQINESISELEKERRKNNNTITLLKLEQETNERLIQELREEQRRLQEILDNNDKLNTFTVSIQTASCEVTSIEIQATDSSVQQEIDAMILSYYKCRENAHSIVKEIRQSKRTLRNQTSTDGKVRYQKQLEATLKEKINNLKQDLEVQLKEKSFLKTKLLAWVPSIEKILKSSRSAIEDSELSSPVSVRNPMNSRNADSIDQSTRVGHNFVSIPKMNIETETETVVDNTSRLVKQVSKSNVNSLRPDSITSNKPTSATSTHSATASPSSRTCPEFPKSASFPEQNNRALPSLSISVPSQPQVAVISSESSFEDLVSSLENLKNWLMNSQHKMSEAEKKSIQIILNHFKVVDYEYSMHPMHVTENISNFNIAEHQNNSADPSIQSDIFQTNNRSTTHIDIDVEEIASIQLPVIQTSTANEADMNIRNRKRAAVRLDGNTPKKLVPIHYNGTIDPLPEVLPHIRYDGEYLQRVKDVVYPNISTEDLGNLYPLYNQQTKAMSPPRKPTMLLQRMRERQYFGPNSPVRRVGERNTPKEYSIYTMKEENETETKPQQ